MNVRKNTEKKETSGKNRVVIIVGASSGIGRETALRLVQQGDSVFNISRTSAAPPVRTVTADASEEGQLTRAVEAVCAETGGLDLLVYCAGYSCLAPVARARSEDYRYLFEVNYFGAVEALKACAPYLEKRRGRAVLVGSMGGELPIPYDGFYSASKAAQTNLMRSLALQLAKDGITVNNVAPGVIYTDRNTKALADPAYAQQVMDSIPVGFYGKPEDCAGIVSLLCSEKGRYITGQSIFVDGGKSIQ